MKKKILYLLCSFSTVYIGELNAPPKVLANDSDSNSQLEALRQSPKFNQFLDQLCKICPLQGQFYTDEGHLIGAVFSLGLSFSPFALSKFIERRYKSQDPSYSMNWFTTLAIDGTTYLACDILGKFIGSLYRKDQSHIPASVQYANLSNNAQEFFLRWCYNTLYVKPAPEKPLRLHHSFNTSIGLYNQKNAKRQYIMRQTMINATKLGGDLHTNNYDSATFQARINEGIDVGYWRAAGHEFDYRTGLCALRKRKPVVIAVSNDNKQVLFAFYGTVMTSPRDWGTNLIKFIPKQMRGKGTAHMGFVDAGDSCEEALSNFVQKHMAKTGLKFDEIQFIFVGHSLGGATSCVAAVNLLFYLSCMKHNVQYGQSHDIDTTINAKNNVTLTTMGQPKLWQSGGTYSPLWYENLFNKANYLRIVTTDDGVTPQDPVSTLPTPLLEHAGYLRLVKVNKEIFEREGPHPLLSYQNGMLNDGDIPSL